MSTEHEATQMLQRPDEELMRAAATQRARRATATSSGDTIPPSPWTAHLLPSSARVAPLDPQVFDPVSAAHVALGNALLNIWPRASFGDEGAPIHAVREVLGALAGGAGFRFDFHGLRVISQGDSWPETGHAAQWRFELPPSPDYGILSVDQSLIDPILGAMLAESTGGVRRVGSMSARDHGLFGFVILRALDALVARHGMPPLVVAVEPPTRDEVVNMGRQGGDVIEAVFLVSTATSAGFMRCFLPSTMARRIKVWRESNPLGTPSTTRLGALAKSEVSLPLCLARLTLGEVDVWDLEAGDVLLPSHHGIGEGWASQLGVQPASPQGARLYTEGARAMDVQLGVDAGRGTWTCEIKDIQVSDHSASTLTTSPPSQGEGTMSEAKQGTSQQDHHTSDLLREVSVELEVRLAGVKMRVDELASMQVGQVIALGVPIGEPVDLVAGGKRVGRGELVNVEGTLGVRVLSRY